MGRLHIALWLMISVVSPFLTQADKSGIGGLAGHPIPHELAFMDFQIHELLTFRHDCVSSQFEHLNAAFNKLYSWCHATGWKATHDSKVVANIGTNAPCGKLEVSTRTHEKLLRWFIRVQRIYFILMKVKHFEMDDSGYNCLNTALQYVMQQNQKWVYVFEHRFCGNRLPSNQILPTPDMCVAVFQRNIIQYFKLSLEYEIVYPNEQPVVISRQKLASIIDLPFYVTQVLSLYVTNRIIWNVAIDYGSSLQFYNMRILSLSARVIFYDGPEDEYVIESWSSDYQSEINVAINVTSVLNKAKIVFKNLSNLNSTGKEVIVILYMRIARRITYLKVNGRVAISNHYSLMHDVYSISSYEPHLYPFIYFDKVQYH